MDIKEKRIGAITRIYYSNPKVQEALVFFSKDREIVPQYFEGFGKRPDIIQYLSDINEMVKKGATSFHASEELWEDVSELNADLSLRELNKLRKGWDLLIDIDSPFLDYSKIAAKLIVEAMERFGVRNYGIKFSGNKGFHILISSKAFPKEFKGIETREMFPEWPRAICEFLMNYIKKEYNLVAGKLSSEEAITKRTKLSKEQLQEVRCENCGRGASKGLIVEFFCPICGMNVKRKNVKITKRRLKCPNSECAGVLELGESEEFYYCNDCKDPEHENVALGSDKYPDKFEKVKGVRAEKIAYPDLVLVASRHLFRMPYSLHEKTALASVVLTKEEIEKFKPGDATPLNVEIKDFMPDNFEGEARSLLAAALDWRMGQDVREKKVEDERYKNIEFKEIDVKEISEDMFPPAIKKLMKGLSEGRKRGLFVLLTFLKSLNFPPEYINKKIREWNEKNDPPLKEGYVRSQIDWHLKQRKKILPPNYSNDAFYRDIGLIDKKQSVKNPLVDVMRKIRKKKNNS